MVIRLARCPLCRVRFLWGLFFKELRAGDTIPCRGCGGAIAGLIIVVTDVLGVVLKESDSNERSGDSND
jgi:hypothetical protein